LNEFLHALTSFPGWPIVPIGMLVATWVGGCFALSLSDAGLARRRFGRGLHRYMAIPDAELDREIETALHSGRFLASALVPALGVTALLMAAMTLGTWIRDAEGSLTQRQAILFGGLVIIGFAIPAFISWSLGRILTRSLDRKFARRLAN
jgi:hypothetical protein